MEIQILQGTEEQLYKFIAQLVMDPKVLKQNDGVAFKTTENHVWVLAIEGQECLGFIPIQKKKNFGEVNNYYIRERDKEMLSLLLSEAEQQVKEAGYSIIIVIAQKADYEVLNAMEYTVDKPFVRYTRFSKKL
jgi:hypothetical protein